MRSAADLQRFVEAQDRVYDDVRRELAAGRKTTHWMWFVFPQLRGLGRSAHAIFGSPDDLKFRSSMTLFAAVAPGDSPFGRALEKYFDGIADEATHALLRGSG